MSVSPVQKAFAAIIIANVIWGAAAPIFKVSLTNIPPFTLAFWRFFLGALILLALLGKNAPLPTKTDKDLYRLIGYALSGITVNIIFFFLGLRLTYSINAPIIASGQPIIVYMLALAFLRETFHLKKLLGMMLGTAGIIIIVIQPLVETGVGGSFLGNLFLVVATLAAIVQTIIGKSVLRQLDPLSFTFWAFVIGAASFLPLAIYEGGTLPNLYQSLDIRGYMGIAYGAICSSTAAYTLYAWGLSKINASDVSMFSYIDPVVGTVIAYFFLHEPITFFFILGSILIFGGILLAEGAIAYRPVRMLIRSVNKSLR